MKTNKLNFILSLLVLLSIQVLAQAPNAFNYQAVLRNSGGNVLANQAVTLRFSIRTISAIGTIQYQETRALTTNQFGLATHAIGTGTIVSGTFSGITWNSGDKYLQVEVNTGSGFVNLGTDKLNSVPYALNAGSNTWNGNGNNISNANSGNVGIGTTNPSYKFDIVGGSNAADNLLLQLRSNFTGTNTATGIRLSNTTNVIGDVGQVDLLAVRNASSIGEFIVKTNNVERMRITGDGNVGIGTTTPQSKLEIEGTGNVMATIETTSGSNSESRIDLKSGTTSWRLFSRESDQTFGIFNGVTRLRINVATNEMRLMETGGFVGIGIAPASELHLGGGQFRMSEGANYWYEGVRSTDGFKFHGYNGNFRGAYSSVNGVYTSSSDLRFKKDIEPVGNILNKVMSIKPSYYLMNEQENNSQKSMGLIAQEVLPLFPEFVHYHEDIDRYSLDYSGLSVVAIKAIQELTEELRQLKKEIEILKTK